MNMIENVARAIEKVGIAASNGQGRSMLDSGDPKEIEVVMSIAKAAIQAMREPTEEMIVEGHGYANQYGYTLERYQAMIDAALKE